MRVHLMKSFHSQDKSSSQSRTRTTQSSRSNTHSQANNTTKSSTTKNNTAKGAVTQKTRKSTASKNTAKNASNTLSRRQYMAQNRNKRAHNKKKRLNLNLAQRIFLWVVGIFLVLAATGTLVFAYLYFTTEIPKPEKIALSARTTVYYNDGTTPIGTFADQNRDIISCKVLPHDIENAVVSSEDRTFYKNSGIDLKGIARALINNITHGTRQGGSTITQQYAERYYLGETKTYLGKLHEAILSLKIAQTQSKSEVLCNYLNTIYWGRGSYGIQAAARAYFNKDAKDLDLSQAAMLAGIIPAPNYWDPAKNLHEAELRFHRVLRIMKEDGYINQKQFSEAKMPQTVAYNPQNVYAGPNGYLLSMVRNELISSKAFTANDLDTGGYRIVTTIDKAKQDWMFHVASPSQMNKGILPAGVETGSITVDPHNGNIVAFYAGDNYLKKPLNNITQALYEPGSTMKPFALLAAVQQGVSLDTQFNGRSPQRFPGIDQAVRNYGNENFGNINLYRATADSVNTVYMALQEKIGVPKLAQVVQTAGISPKLVTGKNPFTVLGNDGVHVWDIAQAYSTLANQGNKPTLHLVESVKDPHGKDLYKPPTGTQNVFNAHNTQLVVKAMQTVVQYGTGVEARSLGRQIAAKTGTANDSTAGSFVALTPNTVTVFAMWKPGPNGSPAQIPPFHGYSGGSDYPVHMFTVWARKAFVQMPKATFPNVKDMGKIGGPDGSWGLGKPAVVQQAPVAPAPPAPNNGGAADNNSGSDSDQDTEQGNSQQGTSTQENTPQQQSTPQNPAPQAPPAPQTSQQPPQQKEAPAPSSPPSAPTANNSTSSK